MNLRLDHVIIAVSDLDGAAARLYEEHGLASVFGGRHEGIGTANRIVPLGEDYLELMGVDDLEVARTSPLGQYLLAFLAHGDRLFAWCVSTDDITVEGERIGAKPDPMQRIRPDGSALSWRLAGLDSSMADRSLPFFIQWDDPSEHPAATPIEHAVDVRGITQLEVVGDRGSIRNRLGGADLPVTVVAGDAPGPSSVTIATASGDIALR